MPIQQSGLHNDLIKRMQARAASNQNDPQPLGHCTACDPKRSLRPKNDKKHATSGTMRKKHGLGIMLGENPQGQGSTLKTERQQLSMRRKIERKPKTQN